MELEIMQYSEVSYDNLLEQKKQEMLQYIQQYKSHYEKQIKHVKQLQKQADQLQITQQQLKIKIKKKQEQLQAVDIQTTLKISQKQQELEKIKTLQQQVKTNFRHKQYKLLFGAHLVQHIIEQKTEILKQLQIDKKNVKDRMQEQINFLQIEKIVLQNLQETQQDKLSMVRTALSQVPLDVQTQMAYVDDLNTQIEQTTEFITELKQQQSSLKASISTQQHDNQQKNEINEQIKILQDQKKSIQDQLKGIEEKQHNEVKVLNESFTLLNNQLFSNQKILSDLNNQMDIVSVQEQIAYDQIAEANQNLFKQREKLNSQFQHYQKKENSQKSIHLDEKQMIQIKQEKLQARYQEFIQSYEQHCNEIVTLKNSYETTINNTKRKIHDLNQQFFELKLEQEEEEYIPQYYIINKGKGKYIRKPNSVVEEEESASESDDDHHTIIVKFQTKNQIKSSKKKINIELENGTYYLTYNGYIQKTKKDDNILIDCRKNALKNFNFSYRVKLFPEFSDNSKWTVKNNRAHKWVGATSGSKIFLKVKQD